jgi:hypothetical protein
MSKFAPFMTVEFVVNNNDVEYAAECVADDIFENYNYDSIEALGLQYRDFVKEITEMYEFSVMVKKAVAKYGPDALSDPWDYMDFEVVTRSPAFNKVRDVVEMLENVISEAEQHERAQKSNACEQAIETLKAAGFKIVKA